MPLRAIPRVGAAVTVIDLDSRMQGVVAEVREGGRRLLVHTDEGGSIEFVLRRATARFTAEPGSAWPQLRFSEPD